jgi:hypothetical protein
MKYLAVAAHLAIVICAIDQQYRTPPAPPKPAAQQYCYGYIPGWAVGMPCAWLPIEMEV